MKRIISILLAILMIATSIPLVALPVFAEEETTYSVGDHIQYGNYPQSKVTDTTTLTKLNKVSKNWISYNYYTGSGSDSDGKMTASDYMKYADIDVDGDGLRDYRAVTFTQYRPYGTGYTSSSTYQYNNGYTPNNVYYFKYEPISWRVLDPSSGLIMCESILDSQTYNDYVLKSGTVPEDGKSAGYGDSSKTYYASDYYNSSIRKWLNEDFYNTAFTLSQKASIRNDVELNNDCYSSSNPQYNSQASYDKIFLLSYDEVKTSAYGFSSVASDLDTARRAQGTDYAKSQGLWVDKSASYYGNSRWWLRSPDFYSDWAIGVHTDGYSIYGRWVIYTSLGVRPACRLIDLKSDVSKSSGKDIGSGLSVKKRVELVSSITALNDNNSITYKDNKYSTDKIEFRANIINRFFSKYATTNNLNKTHEYDKQFDEIVVSIPDTDLLYFKSGILGLGKTTELSYKPNEAITLSIGDSFELTNSEKTSSSSTYHDVLKGLELYVNKSYAWHNDEISKSVDVNISVYYNGEVINSSTETITINNTANENNENVKKEIDKKAKIVADYLKKSTCNLQNSFLEGLFTKEEWKAIQYAFQCKALLSGISKDAYKEMGLSDKIVNKLFKKWELILITL